MRSNVVNILSLQYSEYEKVVIEDRVGKEQARRKAEQELEELKSAIKVSLEFAGSTDEYFVLFL